jgi:hypothetical protein
MVDQNLHPFICMYVVMQVYNLPPPSDEMVQTYMDLNTLPTSVLKEVVVARNENDAATLVRTYIGEDRVGPANTHQNDPDAMFNQAMAGPDAIPPLIMTTNTTPVSDFGKCVYQYRFILLHRNRCNSHRFIT